MNGVETERELSSYPLPVRWRKRLSRLVGRTYRGVTLETLRAQVRARWPDVSGVECLVLGGLMAVLRRRHDGLFNAVCRHALRRRRRATSRRGAAVDTVLHVTGSFDLGGSQTQIRNLCTTPSARFAHRAIEIFPEMNFLYRRGQRVDRDRYTGWDPVRRALSRLVTDMGTRSYQLVQVWKLFRDFRFERPAIVVGWGHEMSVTAFAAAALAGVPHVVTCIRTVNPGRYRAVPRDRERMLQRLHRAMQPLVSGVIVNSTMLQADHAEWVGASPREIAVCANGMRFEPLTADQRAEARQRVRRALAIAADATVITNVGRFSDEKGQLSLVEAQARLSRTPGLAPVVWLLVGDGSTLADVQAAAAGRGFTNFRFAGRSDAVRDVLGATDIFVMPSDFEGMPNAMMEAMAAGLPCVSTRMSGARDVARDGVEALYYDAGDADALAHHLARLMQQPDDARAMGQRAARRVAEFSVERAQSAFDAVLASLDGRAQLTQ